MNSVEQQNIMHACVAMANSIKKECALLIEMMDFIGDSERISARISAVENDADEVSHQIAYYYRENGLNNDKTAMNIYAAIQAMEACTDEIEELAKVIVRYNVTEVNDVLVHSVAKMHLAAEKNNDLCISFFGEEAEGKVIKKIMDLDKFKIDYLKVYDQVIRELFSGDYDPVDVVRWKEVYTKVKDVFEAFEDISDAAFRSIVVNNFDNKEEKL